MGGREGGRVCGWEGGMEGGMEGGREGGRERGRKRERLSKIYKAKWQLYSGTKNTVLIHVHVVCHTVPHCTSSLLYPPPLIKLANRNSK